MARNMYGATSADFTVTAAAYAYGADTNVANPGRDEAVVTDAAILAAVSAIVDPE